jgi:hypothetical protein
MNISRGVMMILRLLTIILILTGWIPLPASSQSNDLGDTKALALNFENDTFFRTDRCYTGGHKLTWITKALVDTRKSSWIKWMPFTRSPDFQNALSFSLGQSIYTPDDITLTELLPNDRPYAGHLYLSIGVHSRSLIRKDLWELSAGMVGPASFVAETQKFVHKITGAVDPQGWQNQLHNEFVLGLVFERKQKILRWGKVDGFSMELIPHIGAGVGNLYIYAATGAQVKFGWNMPNDFGAKLIRPGGSRSTDFREKGPFGIYTYVMIDGKGVARNIFLDGNTFGVSHNVQKKPWTVELILGLSVRFGRFNLGYEQIFWSKRYMTESRNQIFGSLNLTISL